MANITDAQMQVLINIIGAVETGGQVYGQRRYNDYTNAYTNSSAEDSITIGAFQEFKNNAKALLQDIKDQYPKVFSKYDNADLASDLKKSSWSGYNPSKTSAKAKAIVNIISSEEGKKVQDQRIVKLLNQYITYAETLGITEIDALFEAANFVHQGGNSALKRIIGKTKKPYTLDNLYAACQTDIGNQVGAYKTRQKKVYQWLKEYLPKASSNSKTTTTTKKEVSIVSVNFNNYYGKISNSGGDENGGIHGGTAGDQTGNEWCIRNWYNRPWSCVLRHPNQEVRELIAELGIEAANNNKIGYDQYQRDTYWTQLQKAGYRPSKITVACEADCSAGVIANTKAVGYLLGISALKNIGASYTGNMRTAYKNAGFQVLTDSKYLTSGDYLLPGDILLNDGAHTATNLGIGSKSGGSSSNSSSSSSSSSGSLNTTAKWTGVVTADELNVRKWAGTENGTCSFSPLKEGTKIEVCDTIKDINGDNWYYIKYNGKYGFVHSGWVSKVTSTSTTTKKTTTTTKKTTTTTKKTTTTTKKTTTTTKKETGKYSRSAVVNLINSWIGKNEADGSYKSIIDIYNSYTGKFPRGTKMEYGWAWCACTWSALAIKLGYTAIMPIEISCYYIIERAKEMGVWVEQDSYVPSPGDAVLYDWDDNGAGDNTGAPDHIGTVTEVHKDQGYFLVVEGNYSNSVKQRKLSINGRYIRGFITPKYDATGTITPTTTKKSTSTSGTLNTVAKWTGKVTADSLNVRTWAGTENKTCSFSPLTEGTKVSVCDSVKANNGDTWYYIKYNGKYGFVHSAYIAKV